MILPPGEAAVHDLDCSDLDDAVSLLDVLASVIVVHAGCFSIKRHQAAAVIFHHSLQFTGKSRQSSRPRIALLCFLG